MLTLDAVRGGHHSGAQLLSFTLCKPAHPWGPLPPHPLPQYVEFSSQIGFGDINTAMALLTYIHTLPQPQDLLNSL